ncbi:MAG: succinate dehydrogenase [Christensenellaceae bacterium]|nr:succinate dehydrogenase [Christensenellaceae bacterium]
MKVNVYRCDPDAPEKAGVQTFCVPAAPDWSVMDVLDYISAQLDSSLAYYRHSACDHGICGRCALRVDGKVVLACMHEIGDRQEITLEPKNDKIIRDLVVR